MDMTTDTQRAAWALQALESDAYIRRKFGRELADLRHLATPPPASQSATPSDELPDTAKAGEQ
jgi:hypothetical protein